MANLKWLVILLLFLINLIFLTLFLKTTFIGNQGVSVVSTGRIRDPFPSGIKKYLEQKGIASNDRVAIELSSMDQKIKINFSVARNFGKPLTFLQQLYIATTPSNQLKIEPSTSDTETITTQTNIIQPTNGISRQPYTASQQTTPLPETTTSITRVKRELVTDSEMKEETTNPSLNKVARKAQTRSPGTTQSQNSTGRAAEESSETAKQTTLVDERSTPSGRIIRDTLTPFPQTTLLQELKTSTGHKETSTPVSQIKSSTASSTFLKEASTESGVSKKQKSTIIKIYRVLRAVSTSLPQAVVIQEVTTPNSRILGIKQETTIPSIDRVIREAITSTPKKNLVQEITTFSGEDIQNEQSTLKLNLSTKQATTIPSRIERDVLMPTHSLLKQEVTRPNGRIFREISTQIPVNIKEESILSSHKKPFFKEKKFMEGFIRDSFSALIEELKQVKLQAMKRISSRNDDPTFPPPTDPEGTDF